MFTPSLTCTIINEIKAATSGSQRMLDGHMLKVTGESSIEIFATKNEAVYISPRVHVSNKVTRAKYSY